MEKDHATIKSSAAEYLTFIAATGDDNERAVQFRECVNGIVKEYTIKGYALDDERLKNSGSIITEKYFDELLERIRKIRLSERRFYQKIADIYATSIDYDRNSKTTIEFFKKV